MGVYVRLISGEREAQLKVVILDSCSDVIRSFLLFTKSRKKATSYALFMLFVSSNRKPRLTVQLDDNVLLLQTIFDAESYWPGTVLIAIEERTVRTSRNDTIIDLSNPWEFKLKGSTEWVWSSAFNSPSMHDLLMGRSISSFSDRLMVELSNSCHIHGALLKRVVNLKAQESWRFEFI